MAVIRHDFYVGKAKILNAVSGGIAPRGSIFLTDKDTMPLAVALNKEFPLVYAAPKDIENPEEIAKKLAPILKLDAAVIFEKISKKDDPYEILTKKVPDEIVDVVKAEKIKGIGIEDETLRYYPQGLFLAQTLGFLGFGKNGQGGQYGLEEYYNRELFGSINGADLILNIDSSIQAEAGTLISKATEDWQAESGSIIVMDPKTGAILAMASAPEFDANNYSSVKNNNIFINPATLKRYEPGSVFKPITMAIGIETDAVAPNTEYYNTGRVRVADRIISNSLPTEVLGWQTMTKVLEQSLNTGAVFVEQKIPKNIFLQYLKDFGVDSKTGIDIAEISGDLSALSSGRDINFATASFGQGVALTPIELIRALAVIANGGKLVEPRLVSKIIAHNNENYKTKENISNQIISPETAAKLTSMMIKVIENGSGRRARISGYTIAGKTGTAQVPDLKNGGYKDEYIHTFVAFAPAYNPKFIALIKLDNPKGVRFAESTVVPVFKELADFIFSYLQIPPDKPIEN